MQSPHIPVLSFWLCWSFIKARALCVLICFKFMWLSQPFYRKNQLAERTKVCFELGHWSGCQGAMTTNCENGLTNYINILVQGTVKFHFFFQSVQFPSSSGQHAWLRSPDMWQHISLSACRRQIDRNNFQTIFSGKNFFNTLLD